MAALVVASSLAGQLATSAPSGAVSSALLTWTQLSPAASPPGRADAALAIDSSTGQLLLFGGADSAGQLDDSWSFSGATWSQVDDSGDAGCSSTCTQSPPASASAAMAYDQATGQLVLFGGLSGSPAAALEDTWQWSGSSWAQLDDAGDPGCTSSCSASPPARDAAAMDFDPQTGQLLLFGGLSASGAALNDTWAWNGTTWSQLDATGDPGCSTSCTQSPPARSAPTLTFDPALGEDVLFGGLSALGTPLDDTWAWTGSTWSQIDASSDPGCTSSCSASPPARSAAAAAFDQATGQLVLLAGQDVNGNAMNDTWSLAPSGWSQIDDAGDAGCTGACTASPTARSGASLAFDIASGQLLAFGGLSASASYDADTWSLVPPAPTSPGWAQVNATASPPSRVVSMEAYDPATAQLVLFGGVGSSSALNDTWTWNGTGWTQVDDAGDPGCTSTCTSSPSKRYTAAMAYDPATAQLLLFGGQVSSTYGNDTWDWNGSSWVQLDDTGSPGCVNTCPSSPPGRQGGMLAWDPATAQMILFGGYTSYPSSVNDTWAWNGSTWSQIDDAGDPGCTSSCTSSPPARQAGGFTWDPATAQMVLFGGANGTSGLNDTWLWNGTTWSQTDDSSDPGCTTSCTASPLGRDRLMLVYDPTTAQLVLFGGGYSSTYDDTWTWSGSGWSEIAADGSCTVSCPASPSARTIEWADFDPATGQLIIFGGNLTYADTWDWDLVPLALASPSVQMSTALTGYDRTISTSSSLEVADEGSSGWLLTVQASQVPTYSGHVLPSTVINGSSSSATASTAPAQACIGTCVAATGNLGAYPLTVPVSSAATLYSAAAGSGIGDMTLSLDWWQSVPGGAYSSGSNSYSASLTITLSFGP